MKGERQAGEEQEGIQQPNRQLYAVTHPEIEKSQQKSQLMSILTGKGQDGELVLIAVWNL